MKQLVMVGVAIAGVMLGSCGGGGSQEGGALSVEGELAKKHYDEVKAEVDVGNGADQGLACAFLLGLIENDATSEADKQLLGDAKKLCFGDVHKAMYDKTIADVGARSADETMPPFMECVPAQTAIDDAANEIDVPGLAEAKTKAKELCAPAWSE